MKTFTMKAAVVLCLILNLRLCLSLPLATENSLEQTKSSQEDSVPIALLLVVPSPSARDNEEDFSLIEDQIVNLLLRDADTPIQEDHVSEVLEEEPLFTIQKDREVPKEEQLFAEDLRSLNPLLRSDEDIDMKVVMEEPFISEAVDTIPEPRADKDFDKSILPEGPLPSSEDGILDSVLHEEFRLALEETLPSTEDGVQKDAKSIQEEPTIKDRPLERSYENVEHVKGEPIVATYSEVPETAIPILLNCAPKVEQGHLADAAPLYRNHDSNVKETDFNTSDNNDDNNSDVLHLNSPASILSTEKHKRHTGSETGAAHYKVSEDYPETLKGNHHLVSADYPQSNMVRMTTQEQ